MPPEAVRIGTVLDPSAFASVPSPAMGMVNPFIRHLFATRQINVVHSWASQRDRLHPFKSQINAFADFKDCVICDYSSSLS